MQEQKKVRWESILIFIGIIILAAAIVFTGYKGTSIIKREIQQRQAELESRLKQELRREAISLIYAYRNSVMERRQLTAEDFEKGYRFAREFFSK